MTLTSMAILAVELELPAGGLPEVAVAHGAATFVQPPPARAGHLEGVVDVARLACGQRRRPQTKIVHGWPKIRKLTQQFD